MDLYVKVPVVTGASGAIGSAIARARVDVDVCYVGHPEWRHRGGRAIATRSMAVERSLRAWNAIGTSASVAV